MARPMRIAMVGSGASIHVQRWLTGLRDLGHDVRLFAHSPELDATVIPRGIKGVLALRRELRGWRPDVVNAQYVQVHGIMAALAGFRPLVVSAWGSDVLPQSFGERVAARFALARADLVHAQGPNMMPALDALGVRESRVLYATYGVDVKAFDAGPAADARPVPILSTRGLAAVYDPATLIRAAASLEARGIAAPLRLVGDGPLRGELEALAKETGAAVEFVGRVPHDVLAGEYARARVFTSASLSDGVSVSLLEALSSGAFPVVSDIPANRPWVEHGVTGLLFPPGDADACAACLERALSDGGLVEGARALNRARAEADGDAGANLARFADALERLVKAYA